MSSERVSRTYTYRAIVCRSGGTWTDYRGEFTQDNAGSTGSPGRVPRAAQADCERRFVNASHIFIIKTRLKKTTRQAA